MRRLALLVLLLVAACKEAPAAKMNAVREVLLEDAPTFDAELAACSEKSAANACLGELATAVGSKSGFNATKPDQSAATAVAILLVRDRHGEWVAGAPDGWLQVMRKGRGPGADALRLAVALRLSKTLPPYARTLTDADAVGFLRDVGSALPGSCSTYAALGAGADDKTLPAEEMSDHSACVQKDLGRGGGPGGTYGHGVWRSAAGLLAFVREATHALKDGLGTMGGKYKDVVLARLGLVDGALAKLVLVTLEDPPPAAVDMLGEHRDAGVLPAAKDAGADGRP